MSQEQLRKSLDGLRDELNELGEDSHETRERLSQLIAELEVQIEELGESGDTETLVDNLRKRVEYFEVEHPRVTRVVNDIMMTLSNMGI
ncbi:MAG: DUF4404 family protein [Gammaproteobacteria bacterium]|nr:DUF4404 family protein [Gammaproteobacteria bacterium]